LSDSGSGPSSSQIGVPTEEDVQEMAKKKKFRDKVEKLIKEAKGTSVESVKKVLDEFASNEDERPAEIKKAVNALGKAGWSALHFSIYMGNMDITKALISFGANPNIESNDGWTPL